MKMVEQAPLVTYRCPVCGHTTEDVSGLDLDCPECARREEVQVINKKVLQAIIEDHKKSVRKEQQKKPVHR